MEDLKSLLAKKMKEQKEPMPENRKEAKMSVLNELKKLMDDKLAGDLKGLKKVTVASDSKEGLKEGLEKAEEVLEKSPEMGMEEESEDEEEMDLEQASVDELKEMLSLIQEKLDAKMKG